MALRATRLPKFGHGRIIRGSAGVGGALALGHPGGPGRASRAGGPAAVFDGPGQAILVPVPGGARGPGPGHIKYNEPFTYRYSHLAAVVPRARATATIATVWGRPHGRPHIIPTAGGTRICCVCRDRMYEYLLLTIKIPK